MATTRRDTGTGGRATIRDIAQLAGVSVATVSRVINDRPDVAPETRDVVLRYVREHNFTTNRSARALSGGRTGHIGMTMPMVRGDYFSDIPRVRSRLPTSRTCESSSTRRCTSTSARSPFSSI